MMKVKPTVLCFNETWLDPCVKDVQIEGYSLMGRRDRRDGRECGGVAIFGISSQADSMTLLQTSDHAERMWVLVHSN